MVKSIVRSLRAAVLVLLFGPAAHAAKVDGYNSKSDTVEVGSVDAAVDEMIAACSKP
ncbi:MAG TPA: hypothetical protein VFE13_08590 [Caulobacteraceae bacterium]|jgi:hypothetical protein|nr:hypothetical protein [Caulobacteraceae bacterium]